MCWTLGISVWNLLRVFTTSKTASSLFSTNLIHVCYFSISQWETISNFILGFYKAEMSIRPDFRSCTGLETKILETTLPQDSKEYINLIPLRILVFCKKKPVFFVIKRTLSVFKISATCKLKSVIYFMKSSMERTCHCCIVGRFLVVFTFSTSETIAKV